MQTPERIAVIGISGSGKSTFARALAERSGLPLLHSDRLEWMPGWRERPPEELAAMHCAWLAEPRWIIEGWIETDRAERLRAADLVIDLDLSRWRCAWRVARRMLARRRRDEMPENCVDRWRFRTLAVALLKLERPSIDAALAAARPKHYVRLRRSRSVREFLAWSDKLN